MKTPLIQRLSAFLIRSRLIIISVLTGLIAATIAAIFLLTPTHSAIVTSRNLQAGDIVTADALTRTVSSYHLPPDSAQEINDLVGKRTRVDLPSGTVMRTAYTRPNPENNRSYDTLSLPVQDTTASLLSPGDFIDIYGPGICHDECPAQILTQHALVIEVINSQESTWGATQSSAIIIGIDPSDTSVVAGVPDPTTLTIVLRSS
ncbi:MAG: SAF domain-containing protein [Actinomycetaceae bacterium]|nr:SAF domain-containing protein [Actinomycetaceae bacterium]